MKKLCVLPFVLLSITIKIWGQQALYVDPSIDVLHYKFAINLEDEVDTIRGRTTITVQFVKQTSLVAFDLMNKNVEGRGMQVNQVTHRGHIISFSHINNIITLRLPQSVPVGDRRTYVIQYSGIPADGLIIGENKFGERTFFGDNWPNRARHWLPTVDHPADKASCEFVVVAPQHYQVVSNGIKVEQSNMEGKKMLSHWKEKNKLPTKVMVIGVARFAVALSGTVRHIPVSTWVFPQNKKEGFIDFDVAPRILDYFQEHIGRYPYQKLANVQSKTRYGGMENASAIFYYENSVNGKREREALIAHEIAHQWFGNTVSAVDWPHIWLSEGFATYFTNLYMEHAYGFDKLKHRMKDQRDKVIAYYQKNANTVIDTLTTDLNLLLNPNSYEKGSWVLHMLRRKIGDLAFWQGMRAYYAMYEYGNASTQDLLSVMEETSQQHLSPFFEQWLKKEGHPVLSVTWQDNRKQSALQVTLVQSQPFLFTFPIDVEVQFADGTATVHTLQMHKRTENFVIASPQKPYKLVIDPNVWLLYEEQKGN